MPWWIWLIIAYVVGLLVALRLADKDYRQSIKEGDADPVVYGWAIVWPVAIYVFFGSFLCGGGLFSWIAKIRNASL